LVPFRTVPGVTWFYFEPTLEVEMESNGPMRNRKMWCCF
jgi:hypothetical protein